MILTKEEVIPKLKELNKAYLNDDYFRNLYTTSSLSRQQSDSALDYDYSKAINEAYSSSMRNLDYLNNSALGTGYKEKALMENQNALLDAFNTYKENYASGKQSIMTQFDEVDSNIYKSYLQQESRIANEADTLIKYFDEYYNYINYLYENNPEVFNVDSMNGLLTSDKTALKSKYDLFSRDGDNPYINDDGELTEAGKSFFDTIEMLDEEGVPTFGQYLEDTNKDLWEWARTISPDYMNNGLGLFREATGRDDKYKYNYSSYDHRIADVAGKWDKEYVTLTGDNVITWDYLSDNDKDKKEIETELSSGKWKLSDNANDQYDAASFKESAEQLTDGEAGGDKSRVAALIKAADAAIAGTLSNGTILDINAGGGTNLWVYWNGKFVKLKKQS